MRDRAVAGKRRGIPGSLNQYSNAVQYANDADACVRIRLRVRYRMFHNNVAKCLAKSGSNTKEHLKRIEVLMVDIQPKPVIVTWQHRT